MVLTLAALLIAAAVGPAAHATEAADATAQGDPHIPSLVWAPLKTGFRAVVAWETNLPSLGAVDYAVNGTPAGTLSAPTPRQHHVFFLDDLPVGGNLTFTARYTIPGLGAVRSAPHTMRLVNGPTAYDAEAGAYTVNLAILANEHVFAGEKLTLRDGVDLFAQRLWDATDGHVRAGKVVILFDDYESHDSGYHTCGRLADGVETPACHRLADAVFSFDNRPTSAGVAWKGGITDPWRPMYMNNLYEATPLYASAREVGATLTHELGHYAFWMNDLYPEDSTNPDCWDHDTGISIMGANRDATEFDDAVARCPNKADDPRYVPSWTILRKHYANIPDRPNGPAEGPTGTGGAFEQAAFELSYLDAGVDPTTSPGGIPESTTGEIAVNPRGDARAGSIAVSGTGDANASLLALSGTGSADSTWVAATGLGNASAIFVAASGVGNTESVVLLAASGMGESHSTIIAASGTGNSTAGAWAVSGTGNSSASVAVSILGGADGAVAISARDVACDATGLCLAP